MPFGKGTMSGKDFCYTGSFKSGLFEGKGILEDYTQKTVFSGKFYDGKK